MDVWKGQILSSICQKKMCSDPPVGGRRKFRDVIVVVRSLELIGSFICTFLRFEIHFECSDEQSLLAVKRMHTSSD